MKELHKMTVLFVDDYLDEIQAIINKLKECVNKIDTVNNFGAAEEKIIENNYDAMLLDLQMSAIHLPKEYQNLVIKKNFNHYPGWVFYEFVLQDICPALINKTGFLTANKDNFINKLLTTRKIDHFPILSGRVFSKNDETDVLLAKIIKWLSSLP